MFTTSINTIIGPGCYVFKQIVGEHVFIRTNTLSHGFTLSSLFYHCHLTLPKENQSFKCAPQLIPSPINAFLVLFPLKQYANSTFFEFSEHV